jgi:hypothetical protein
MKRQSSAEPSKGAQPPKDNHADQGKKQDQFVWFWLEPVGRKDLSVYLI